MKQSTRLAYFVAVGAACVFTDASSDTDGNVTAWSWSFGDGATTSTQDPSHVYACPAGVYAVSLTVTDDDGATDGTSQNLTVTGDCSGEAVTLTEVSSVSQGGTWVATVRITGGDVGGVWSGGVSGSAGCDAGAGSCDITSPDIRKKEGSVTYTATTLNGDPLSPMVSVTVLKP